MPLVKNKLRISNQKPQFYARQQTERPIFEKKSAKKRQSKCFTKLIHKLQILRKITKRKKDWVFTIVWYNQRLLGNKLDLEKRCKSSYAKFIIQRN